MPGFYHFALLLLFIFAAIVFVLLFFISAPYGKFLRKGWGPAIKSKWAWMIMESPSPLLMIFFFISSAPANIVPYIFLAMWLSHYIYRTLIYPFRQSGRNKAYPFILVAMAFIFNCLNGTANGYGIFMRANYTASWLLSWQFITGLIVFLTGFLINKTADEKLRMLKKESSVGYVIPRGWLFEYISSPHYFGEIVEWGGWALATWSLPGLAFFVFTFANLFPRAVLTHRWYKNTFDNYPPSRKAVIPFVV